MWVVIVVAVSVQYFNIYRSSLAIEWLQELTCLRLLQRIESRNRLREDPAAVWRLAFCARVRGISRKKRLLRNKRKIVIWTSASPKCLNSRGSSSSSTSRRTYRSAWTSCSRSLCFGRSPVPNRLQALATSSCNPWCELQPELRRQSWRSAAVRSPSGDSTCRSNKQTLLMDVKKYVTDREAIPKISSSATPSAYYFRTCLSFLNLTSQWPSQEL